MNREEVSRCYGLSMELLEQYENWNLRKNGKKDFSYSAQDLQRLSLVVLLQGIGFSWEECRVFLCLENRETSCRLQMLEQHRNSQAGRAAGAAGWPALSVRDEKHRFSLVSRKLGLKTRETQKKGEQICST